MNLEVISATWEGDKPGLFQRKIYIKFKSATFDKDKSYSIIWDFREGQELISRDGTSGDLFVGVLVSNDQNSWIWEKTLQPGYEWFSING